MNGATTAKAAAMTRPRHILIASSAGLLLAGYVGFATLVRSAWGEAGREGGAVTIRLFQFQPEGLEVKAGTRVTWTNTDNIEHTVTSGSPDRPDGRFNSPLDGKDSNFSYTFSEPGTYSYFCKRHDHMRGEIRVNESRKGGY